MSGPHVTKRADGCRLQDLPQDRLEDRLEDLREWNGPSSAAPNFKLMDNTPMN